MYQPEEGIGLSVEVNDSSESYQFVVVEIDQACVKVGMFHYLSYGRDHQICVSKMSAFYYKQYVRFGPGDESTMRALHLDLWAG